LAILGINLSLNIWHDKPLFKAKLFLILQRGISPTRLVLPTDNMHVYADAQYTQTSGVKNVFNL